MTMAVVVADTVICSRLRSRTNSIATTAYLAAAGDLADSKFKRRVCDHMGYYVVCSSKYIQRKRL